MQAKELAVLSQRRLEHAGEDIAAAKTLYNNASYKSATNRCYYTVFHAMRAVLALDGIDMKHHSGIIAEFRRRYIKTNVFDKSLSVIISTLSDARNDSDYDDFYVVSKMQVEEYIRDAELFLTAVTEYLKDGNYPQKNV